MSEKNINTNVLEAPPTVADDQRPQQGNERPKVKPIEAPPAFTIARSLADQIMLYRLQEGVSWAALGRAAGVTGSTARRVLDTAGPTLTMDRINAFCSALRISPLAIMARAQTVVGKEELETIPTKLTISGDHLVRILRHFRMRSRQGLNHSMDGDQTESIVNGIPVPTLCGFSFIPEAQNNRGDVHNKDLPDCEACHIVHVIRRDYGALI